MNFNNTINGLVVYLIYVILLGLFLCFLSCKRLPKISNATVNYSYDSKGLLLISMKNGKSFIIDTGADGSIIFNDRIKINSSTIGSIQVNNTNSFPIKRIDSLHIGDLFIKNKNFVFMEADNTLWKNDTNIVGLIGMDILCEKYCYFDIKNQTITFSDKKHTQTKSPSFVFSYKSSKTPASDMYINGAMFEDVLFDTGFSFF